MNDVSIDKRTVLAFVLIGVILLLWMYLFPPTPPPPSQAPVTRSKSAAEPESSKVQPEELRGGQAESIHPAEVNAALSGKQWVGQGRPQEIVFSTDLYEASLTSQGGGVRRWSLKRFFGAEGKPVQLVGGDGLGNLAIRLVTTAGDTFDTGQVVWKVEQERRFTSGADSVASIAFTLELGVGRAIRKEYTFYRDRYSFDLRVEMVGLQGDVADKKHRLVWNSGLAITEPNVAEDMSYSKAYALLGKDLEEWQVKAQGVAHRERTGNARWVATRTKYFAVALIPKGDGLGAEFLGQGIPVGDQQLWRKYSVAIVMPYTQAQVKNEFTVYIGPLDYDIVKRYGVGLEQMMNFGWKIIQPISIFILWSLKAMHRFISNYGVVVVLFSILVKVVLYPLTYKSYVSMKKMQELQPLLLELRERHKGDPQRLNRETMKLYKEHGVNPMGGCLPVLLQMPVLYALWIVFRTTIEFRQAKFVWWIKDLSAPDTIFVLPFSLPLYGNTVNVLPILMGITMFIQNKMTMKDPKQKMMVYFMPIFFTLIFNTFPSGLNLYYALFNLLSIGQQILMQGGTTAQAKPAEVQPGRAVRRTPRKV